MGRLSEFDEVELRAMGYRKPTLSRPFKLANFPGLGELRVWLVSSDEYRTAWVMGRGICLACGETQDGCPSGTSGKPCVHCGEPSVCDVGRAYLLGRIALPESERTAAE